MKKVLATLALAVTSFVLFCQGEAGAFLSAPHDSLNCVDCHAYNLNGDAWYGSGGGQIFPPANRTIDDTLRNFICLRCHDGSQSGIPGKKLHSSHSFTPGVQTWTSMCVDCHDPHFQGQLEYKAESGLFLATGTVSGVNTSVPGRTTITFNGGSMKSTGAAAGDWSAKTAAGRGLILVLDRNNPSLTYEIVAATASTVTVNGTVPVNAYTLNSTQFGVIYGQMLKSAVYTGKDGDGDGWGDFREMRMYDREAGGYTGDRNNDGKVDGVCQVCHTSTLHWTNSAATDTHNPADVCTACHTPSTGFKKPLIVDHSAPPPAGGLSHVTDTPFCVSCHAVDNPLAIHKNQCTSCHVSTIPGSIVLQSPGSRLYVDAIQRGECVICHGQYFDSHGYGSAHLKTAQRSTDLSSDGQACSVCHGSLGSWNDIRTLHDVATNGAGACNTCHQSARTDVVAAIASGRGGAAIGCLTCHSTRSNHVAEHDSAGYEDTPTQESNATGSVSGQCFGCHNTMGFTNIASGHVGRQIGVADLNGAAYNGQTITCATCHQSPNTTVLNQIAAGKGGAFISCADCHGARSLPHGGHDAAAFGFSGSCSSCHTGTNIVTSIHKSNCALCHTNPAAGDYSRRTGTNGTAVGMTVASTCANCHASRATDYQNHAQPVTGHNRVTKTTNNTCETCHTGASVVANVHSNTCTLCHTATTGVLKGSATNHAIGGTSNCAQCHATRVSGHASEHDSTGTAGTGEPALTCGNCHSSFANVTTGHVGKVVERGRIGAATVGSVISCATCHDATVPVVVNAIATGKTGATVYCANCHGVRAASHPTDVMPAHSFLLKGSSCDSCHDAAGTADVVTSIHKNNCATCHTATYGLRAGTNGDATSHVVGSTSTCAVCHASRATDYQNHAQPATGHNRVTATTNNTCETCHSGASVVANVHSNTCTFCHTATTGVLKGSATNHAIGGTSNCATCHTTRVSGHVSEHNSTGMAGAGEPALTCSSCHGSFTNVSSGHVGKVVGRGNIGAATVGSVIACATCHDATIPAVVNAITAGKAGTTVYCANCHAVRAANHPADVMPVHSFLLKGSSCDACHDPAGTADVVSSIHKNTCSTCHTATYGLRVGTNGDATKHTLGGTSSCAVCHASRATDYQNHAQPVTGHDRLTVTTNNTCETCHAGASVVANVHSNTCAFCHTATTGVLKGSATSHAIGGTSSCLACHTTRVSGHASEHNSTGMAGTGEPALTCSNCHGTFANVTTGHVGMVVERGRIGAATVGSAIACATCHDATVPAVVNAITAGKAGTTVYCATCHGVRAASHPTDVMPAHSFLLKGSSCDSCHDAAGTADVVTSIHKNNCASCHTATYGLRAGTNGDATRHVAGGTSSCAVCHASRATDYQNHAQPVTGHNRLTVTTNNTCETCHAGASVVANVHANTCTFCHTATSGVLKGSATSHAIGGTSSCLTCHTTRVSGHASEHNSTGMAGAGEPALTCSNCHGTFANVTTGHVGMVVERGRIGVATVGSVIACATCHDATVPAVVNAITAGKTGTTVYCANCHGVRAASHPTDVMPAHSFLLKGSSCDSCHDAAGTADVVTSIHKNNCASCHTATYGLRVGTNGDATRHTLGGTSSCAVCHASRATDYQNHAQPVTGHNRLTVTTNNTCETCHAGTSVVANVHANTCTFCHTATSGVLKGSATNHTIGGTSSCLTCHTTRVSGHASEHNSTGMAGAGEPALTCSNCHGIFSNVSSGHVGKVVVRGNIGAATVGATIACATCHDATVPAVENAITAGKAGMTVFCANCHAVRAANHPTDVMPAHSFLLKGSSCDSCHDVSGTSDVVASIHKGVCASCHTATYGLRVGTNGDATKHTLGGTSSCAVCHASRATDYQNHSQPVTGHNRVTTTTNNTCETCHNGASVVANIHSNTCTFCHTATSGVLKGSATNHTIGGTSNCATCHTTRVSGHVSEHNSTGMAGAGEPALTCSNCHGTFANVTTGHVGMVVERGNIGAATVGSVIACATCHDATVPAVVNAITAGKAGTTVYCATCHGVRNANHPTDVMPAHSFLLKGSSCDSCHDAAGTADVVTAIHKNNCATCHTATYGLRAGTNGDATKHTLGGTSSCAVCHASRATDYQNHVLPATGHNRVTATTNNTCETCHAGASVVANVHSNTCTFCHTATTGVLKGSATNHVIGGTSNCATCHTTRVSGHASEHNSTGMAGAGEPALTCSNCHGTFANVTTGHVGMVVERGNIGAATVGSVIACATCHDATVPAVVNAITAGKAGTTVYCANCHAVRTASHPTDVMPTHSGFLLKGSSCDSCHDAAGTADVVTSIHKNNCASCHTATYGLRVGTNGDATKHTLGGTSSCAVCHASRATDYQNHVLPAAGHSRVTSTTNNTCETCHAGASVVANVHSNTCTFCHTATTGVLKGSATNHVIGGTSNCATCHATSVSGHVSEHNSAGYDKVPAMENATLVCANCHNTMGFGNIASGHVGRTIVSASVDPAASGVIACATCHDSVVTVVVNAITAGKAGTLVACADCHGLRTLPHGGHDASSFAWGGNCNNCHSGASIVANVHKDLCATCHVNPSAGDYTRKAGTKGTALGFTSTATCVDCHNTTTYVPKTYHHARPEAAAGNCTFCHVNGGAAGHTTTVAGYVNCNKCHSATIGTATTAPVDTLNNKIHDACTTCHNTDGSLKTLAQLTRGIVILMPAGTSLPGDGGGSCAICHGEYMYSHTNIDHRTTVSLAANCADCHTGAEGTQTTVPLNPTSNKLHKACASCHGIDGMLVSRISTLNGGTDGGTNGGGSCATCHFTNFATQPHKVVGHAGVVAGQADCTACHTATAGDSVGIPVSLLDGKVHDSCAQCHDAAGRLIGSASGKNGGTQGGTNGGGACGVCHIAYPNNFLTAHAPVNHVTKGFVTTVAACSSCHSDADTITGSKAHKNSCANCHTANTGVLRSGTKGTAPLGGGTCATCHVGYVGVTASGHDTATAHNNRTIAWSGTTLVCSNCHSSDTTTVGNKGTGSLTTQAHVDALHGKNWNGTAMANQCELCHWYVAGWANTEGLPTTTNVANYITSGKAGTNVACTDCHSYNQTGHGGHDNSTFGWSGTCNTCHSGASIVNDVHKANCKNCHVDPANGDYTRRAGTDGSAIGAVSTATCTTCHNITTYPTGGIHHDTNKAANNLCTDCHSAVTHLTRIADLAACTSCHTGTKGTATGAPVSLTDSMIHDSCRTCHTFNAQKRGILVNFTNLRGVNGTGSLPAGGGTCTACHTVASASSYHHTSNRAAVGQCEYCHTDPRPVSWSTTATPGDNGTASGVNRPTQLACIDCHVSWTGGNMIVTKYTRATYTNLSTDWTRATQHTIPNSASRINSYGICLSCHDGVKASKVSVWHGRPDRFGGTAWTFTEANTAASTTGKTYSRSSCDTTTGDQAHFAAGRSKDTSTGTSPQSLIGGFNIFAPQYGLKDKVTGNAGSGGRCDNANKDLNQYNAKAFDTAAFSRITIPKIVGKNDYATPQTGTSYAVPVFASLAPQTGTASAAADDIKIQSAIYNGTNITVTATHTQGTCATLTAKYGTTTLAMSGTTTCSAALSGAGYPANGTTVDVTTSNTSGVNALGYRITNNSTPQPAAASNDAYSVAANSTTGFAVMSNDSGSGITLQSVTQPTNANCTTAISGSNVNFTAANGWAGSTTFTYTILATDNSTSTGTVSVTVSANNPPVVTNDSYSVNTSSTTNLTVLANDTDSDGPSALTVSTVGTPSCGTAVKNANNTSVDYTAPATAGTCTFSYTAYDGVNSVNGTVTMTVSAAPTGVAALNNWANLYTGAPANTGGTIAAGNVTVSAGTNRLLLVAVAMETGSSATPTVTATLGGTALTQIRMTATSGREHMWMGYMKDAQIGSGAKALSVTYSNATGNASGVHVKWASYSGVNQTTPIPTANGSNATNTATTTATFGAAINYVANGMTVVAAANGGTVAGTLSATPAFTAGTAETTNGHVSLPFVTAKHTASGSYASGTTVDFTGGSSRTALVVATMQP